MAADRIDATPSVATRVRSRVRRSGERVWRVEDFDGPPSAVNNELRRLVASGELKRVRRGVYWHGARGRFGMTGAPQADVVSKVVGAEEAIGATGWHAANLLGLSTQVAPVETFAVTHRRPEGLTRVNVTSRAARSGRRKAKLKPLEVTFLEVLDGWDRYVEVDAQTALDRLAIFLRGPDVRADRLVQASGTEPPVVRERLRAVLTHAGFGELVDKVNGARDPRTRKRALRILRGAQAA